MMSASSLKETHDPQLGHSRRFQVSDEHLGASIHSSTAFWSSRSDLADHCEQCLPLVHEEPEARGGGISGFAKISQT